MKKIALLTEKYQLYMSNDQTILDRMVQAIMKENGSTGAVVCLKDYPKAKPKNFQYFGNFTDYFDEEYLKKHSSNVIIGLPNISKLISIEILPIESSIKFFGHDSKVSDDTVWYLKKHYKRKLSKSEIDTKTANIFIETSIRRWVEVEKSLKSLFFDIINITKNDSNDKINIYFVRKSVALEIKNYIIFPKNDSIVTTSRTTFLSKILKLSTPRKLEEIHV